MNTNLLIDNEVIKEWCINTEDIRLELDGRVWFADELTNLKWKITWNIENENKYTIVIEKCLKGEE